MTAFVIILLLLTCGVAVYEIVNLILQIRKKRLAKKVSQRLEENKED